MRKLFITGINGFLGGSIAREAKLRGYSVSGLDVKPGESSSPGITIADITDTRAVEDAMLAAKPDYVLHYAAITASVEFKRDMARCFRINIGGFINAIDSALKSGCKKFVYASSSAVYADSFSEDSRIDISAQPNYYARAKFTCELIAESYARLYPGMKVVGIRHFNAYGPMGAEKGEYANLINTFIMQKLNRQPLLIYGDGSQSRDNIYVDDAVKLVLELTEKADRGIYNVGSGLIRLVQGACGAHRRKEHTLRGKPNPLPGIPALYQSRHEENAGACRGLRVYRHKGGDSKNPGILQKERRKGLSVIKYLKANTHNNRGKMAKNDNLYAGVAVVAILAFATTAIIGIIAFGQYRMHASQTNSTTSYITVTATGSVLRGPVAVCHVHNGERHSLERCQRHGKAVAGDNDDRLGTIGLPRQSSSIQTTSYNLYRPYNSSVYTASEGIVVLLPINYTEGAIAALSMINGTYITGVNVQLSKSQVSSLSSTALAIAMQNATTQAQNVAGPNVPLKISSVSINSNGYFYPTAGLALGANPVLVFPGTQSVTQSVTVKYWYTGS